MASDPTLDFLKRFDKAEDWVVVPNVPLMTPHERHNADGTVKYKIGEQRLAAIAATVDAIEAEDGVLPKVQVGHTKKDVEPEILGYVRNRRIGEWGPKQKTGLLGDLWLEKSKASKAQGLPFRSSEFYPTRNQISAVALLARDPELDMGAVLCERGDDVEFYHLTEVKQPMSETVAVVTPPASPPPTVARDLDVETQVRMAREEMAVEYKRQGDTIARLEKELEVERYHRREATAEQQVTQLRAEGYIVKDTARLVKKLAGLSEDAAKAELVEIRENYSRAPIDAPTIRVAEPDAAKQLSREDYDRAVSLATNEKISFDAALAKVRGVAK